jgi:hypothetical protein
MSLRTSLKLPLVFGECCDDAGLFVEVAGVQREVGFVPKPSGGCAALFTCCVGRGDCEALDFRGVGPGCVDGGHFDVLAADECVGFAFGAPAGIESGVAVVLGPVEFDLALQRAQLALEVAGFAVLRRAGKLRHHDGGENAEDDDDDENFDEGEGAANGDTSELGHG